MELTEFLLARIAEDEAAAGAAIDPDRPGTHWHWVMDATDTPVRHGHLQRAQDDGESVSLRTVEEYPTKSGVGPLPHFVVQSGEVHGTGGEHIARWDPARVLAECESKRRIVQVHAITVTEDWINPTDGPAYRDDDHTCAICGWVRDACDTVKFLALPYSDHPDYREEWKP